MARVRVLKGLSLSHESSQQVNLGQKAREGVFFTFVLGLC